MYLIPARGIPPPNPGITAPAASHSSVMDERTRKGKGKGKLEKEEGKNLSNRICSQATTQHVTRHTLTVPKGGSVVFKV